MTRMPHVIVTALSITISASAIAAPPPPPERLLLAVRDGWVTARIARVPLGSVLTELSRETGAVIQGLGSDGERLITVDFARVALREALERLLAPASFTMTVGRGDKLARLTILGGGNHVVLRPPREPLGDPEEPFPDSHLPDEATLISEARGATHPVARTEALSLLGQRASTPTARQAMADVLRDETDAEVRQLALEQLEQAGHPIPLEAIAAVARDDPDGQLRVRALAALVAHRHEPEARATIAWAADNDADPRVRQIASEVLGNLRRPVDQPRDERVP